MDDETVGGCSSEDQAGGSYDGHVLDMTDHTSGEEEEEERRIFRKQMEKERRKVIRGQRVSMVPIVTWDVRHGQPGEIDERSILKRKEMTKAFWTSKMKEQDGVIASNGTEFGDLIVPAVEALSDVDGSCGGAEAETDLPVDDAVAPLQRVGVKGEKRINRVRPLVDEEDGPIFRVLTESLIEREIRLLKEREMELRQEKALTCASEPPSHVRPLANNGEETTRVELSLVTSTHTSPSVLDRSKYLATVRIRQEIEEHIRREQDLQATGSIVTTSEERVDGMVISHLRMSNGIEFTEPTLPACRDDKNDGVATIAAHTSPSSPVPSNAGSPFGRISFHRNNNIAGATRGLMARFIASRGKIRATGSFNSTVKEPIRWGTNPAANWCSTVTRSVDRTDDGDKRRVGPREENVFRVPRRSHSTVESRISEELKEMKDREAELRMVRAETMKRSLSIVDCLLEPGPDGP